MLSLKVMTRKKKSVEEIGDFENSDWEQDLLQNITDGSPPARSSERTKPWITMMTQILIIILQMKSYVGFWSMQLVMSFLSYIQCLLWEIYVLPGILFFSFMSMRKLWLQLYAVLTQ